MKEATSVVALGLLEAAIDTVVGIGKTKDELLCPSPPQMFPGPADVPALSLDKVIVKVNRCVLG